MKISADNIIVRIFIAIMGLLIFYHGISTINDEGFFWRGVFITVGDNKYLTGGLFIFIGLFFLWLSIWPKTIRFVEGEFFKCTKCGKVFDSKLVKNSMCPKCDGALEKLEGFYERHPEFKNK